MGNIGKALGQPAEFQFEGKTYKLSPWTFNVLGKYESFLEDQALRKVHRLAKTIGPMEYQEALDRVLEKISLNQYSYGSPLFGQSFQVVDNLKRILCYSIQENHPEVGMEFTKRLLDSKEGAHLLNLMADVNKDPNEQTSSENSPNPTIGQ